MAIDDLSLVDATDLCSRATKVQKWSAGCILWDLHHDHGHLIP